MQIRGTEISIYKGTEPFVFVSYSRTDIRTVEGILRILSARGFRSGTIRWERELTRERAGSRSLTRDCRQAGPFSFFSDSGQRTERKSCVNLRWHWTNPVFMRGSRGYCRNEKSPFRALKLAPDFLTGFENM